MNNRKPNSLSLLTCKNHFALILDLCGGRTYKGGFLTISTCLSGPYRSFRNWLLVYSKFQCFVNMMCFSSPLNQQLYKPPGKYPKSVIPVGKSSAQVAMRSFCHHMFIMFLLFML